VPKMPRRRFFRLDALEVVLVVALAVVVTWTAARQHYSVPVEARAFRAMYGRSVDSQYDEELFIRDFFNGRRAGFFVDVGANDYRKYNNTYYLEERLGWSGIAVDALGEFAADYERYRPRTRFFSFFVSDVSDTRARFWASRNPLLSSSEHDAAGRDATAREVATITLDDLLTREGVTKVDFLTMDIELAEPKALAGFDLQRFRPDLVCIEAHLHVRQPILDYFTRRGYVVAGRYLRADERNLYFTPLAR
jgi:FkbM family methyltransferase